MSTSPMQKRQFGSRKCGAARSLGTLCLRQQYASLSIIEGLDSIQTRAKFPLSKRLIYTMDHQLLLFSRQYFQLFEPDFLAWPPAQLLRDPNAQAWLYRNLFCADSNKYLPPERYQVRVLKALVSKIEQAIQDPEEDVGYDDVFLRLSPTLPYLSYSV